ncbi:MAG TPA: DUF4097 family beta strand repeat-containing protein [Candidatus Acidoferrum sp.]|nr:DUF4097 family beta strand repeat-containing protein [Candidatus Acidoferrum sp.]
MTNGMRRRGSIFAGLLLVVIGVIFLLDRFDPAFGLGRLIRIYWPILIILWGAAKLIDHVAAQRAGEARAPLLSGGEAALMIVLAFVLAGFVFRDWLRDRYPDLNIEFPPPHKLSTEVQQLQPEPIPAGAHVVIETERGSIRVHAGEGSNLVVHAQKSLWGSSEFGSKGLLERADVVIETAGNEYRIHPVREGPRSARASFDLDVQVPAATSVSASTGHGDIEISGIKGDAFARSGAGGGDVEINGVNGDVTADLQSRVCAGFVWPPCGPGGDAKISGISGDVKLTGRGNGIDLSNISGDVTVEGAFIGTIHARSLAKTIHCVSPWTDLTVAQLTGHLDVDSGDVAIFGANGPARLITHNKDIKVANVLGRIEIMNTHGDVKVTYSAAPREDLVITNDSGDTDVTLPAASTFGVSAVSRSGEVESEFEAPTLKASNENDRGQIIGKIGTTGPTINVTTSYGTIHLHKAA